MLVDAGPARHADAPPAMHADARAAVRGAPEIEQAARQRRDRTPQGPRRQLAEAKPAPLDVRAVRERMHITQRQFAGWFGFPVATLRHWERGNRRPTGTALVLLHVIRDHPRIVLQSVRKARLWDTDCLAAMEPLESPRAPPGLGDRHPPLRPRGPRRR